MARLVKGSFHARRDDAGLMAISRGWLQSLSMVALGVVIVAGSARVTATVPGVGVPQSAQTLAVLVVGAVLGARDGSLSLVAYVLVGGIGIPVFADGGSGWGHLVGPTAGYLLGFVIAAGAAGRTADLGLLRRIPRPRDETALGVGGASHVDV